MRPGGLSAPVSEKSAFTTSASVLSAGRTLMEAEFMLHSTLFNQALGSGANLVSGLRLDELLEVRDGDNIAARTPLEDAESGTPPTPEKAVGSAVTRLVACVAAGHQRTLVAG